MTTSTARIAGISHVALSVSDLARARSFYVDAMGLEELRRPDFGVPGAWFRLGDRQLHVLEVPEVAPVGPGPAAPRAARRHRRHLVHASRRCSPAAVH